MKNENILRLLWISLGSGLFFFLFFGDKTIQNFFYSMGISLLYTFSLSYGNSELNCILNKKFSWIDNTKKRTIYGIIFTILLNVVLVFVLNYFNFVWIQGMKVEKFFSSEMNFTNWFFINFSLLVATFFHAKGFMEEWKKSSKKEVVEQKIIATSANAQFESLKNQLDPHFLFNSLNVLSSLIDENPEQAQKFTASMSKIYRYVLEQKDKELVTVEEEIEFAKTYCELLKTRFDDSVHFVFNISEADKKAFVVPLSLQLLLENGIKHNFATAAKPLLIKIYTEGKNLVIENNFQERELPNKSSGIGLANIVQRYSLLTERNVLIEKTDTIFMVKIPLLTQKQKSMNTTISDEKMAYEKATKRVKELKGFYGNLISYCIVIPFLFVLNIITSRNHLWFYWPMLGWGIGILSHAFQVFGIGKDWEEKKIKEIIDKQNQQKNWK